MKKIGSKILIQALGSLAVLLISSQSYSRFSCNEALAGIFMTEDEVKLYPYGFGHGAWRIQDSHISYEVIPASENVAKVLSELNPKGEPQQASISAYYNNNGTEPSTVVVFNIHPSRRTGSNSGGQGSERFKIQRAKFTPSVVPSTTNTGNIKSHGNWEITHGNLSYEVFPANERVAKILSTLDSKAEVNLLIEAYYNSNGSGQRGTAVVYKIQSPYPMTNSPNGGPKEQWAGRFRSEIAEINGHTFPDHSYKDVISHGAWTIRDGNTNYEIIPANMEVASFLSSLDLTRSPRNLKVDAYYNNNGATLSTAIVFKIHP